MRSSILCSLLLLAASATAASWRVDVEHSTLAFSVERTGAVVEGSFTRFRAAASGDPANPAQSTIELTIEAASLDTANAFRDDHLRSEDFLDVQQFREIHFASTRISGRGSRVRVEGMLTIHGVTKPISFHASAHRTGDRLQITMATRIRRSAFGVGRGDWTDRLISDVVSIRATLFLLRSP